MAVASGASANPCRYRPLGAGWWGARPFRRHGHGILERHRAKAPAALQGRAPEGGAHRRRGRRLGARAAAARL